MKTSNLNYDLGNNITLVSITQNSIDSKVLTLVLNFKSVNKVVSVQFDSNTGTPLTVTPIGLTPTQIHIISTLVAQFLKP